MRRGGGGGNGVTRRFPRGRGEAAPVNVGESPSFFPPFFFSLCCFSSALSLSNRWICRLDGVLDRRCLVEVLCCVGVWKQKRRGKKLHRKNAFKGKIPTLEVVVFYLFPLFVLACCFVAVCF